MKEQYKKTGKDSNLNYALKLISRFSYSELKLRKKLENRGINQDEIDLIITKLKKYKLIDDVEYTKNLINLYLNRRKGPLYIKEKLIEAGVPINIINSELSKVKNEDYIASLNSLINQLIKKFQKKEVNDIENKVIKACLLKGFTYQMISDALSKFNKK